MTSLSEVKRLAAVSPEALEKRAMEILRENYELKEALDVAYSTIEFLRGCLGSDQSVGVEVVDKWIADFDKRWGVIKTCPQCKSEFSGNSVYCTDDCFLTHELQEDGK